MTDRQLVHHFGFVYDSARWQGFQLRPDDIIISTPPKCGTTWTQMICAMLIFQTPELPQPLALISPWLDMLSRARRDVVADLDAQQHRRFIKTHTPLDGLPLHESVTYICVGRDPRDVAISMDNHNQNMDRDAFEAARDAAAKIDGIELPPLSPRPPPPADPRERFWLWADNPAPITDSASTLLRTLRHLEGFWNVRTAENVVLLHYDDLKEDLGGQMRGLADRLGITVPAERWPELVHAATFDAMRERAADTVPSPRINLWRDREQFFHRGTSGQWRDLLDEDDLRRYEKRVAELTTAELSLWLHRGIIVS